MSNATEYLGWKCSECGKEYVRPDGLAWREGLDCIFASSSYCKGKMMRLGISPTSNANAPEPFKPFGAWVVVDNAGHNAGVFPSDYFGMRRVEELRFSESYSHPIDSIPCEVVPAGTLAALQACRESEAALKDRLEYCRNALGRIYTLPPSFDKEKMRELARDAYFYPENREEIKEEECSDCKGSGRDKFGPDLSCPMCFGRGKVVATVLSTPTAPETREEG